MNLFNRWYVLRPHECHLLALSQTTNSRLFSRHNFRFDENGRKFPKRLENTMVKGEIARYEQFLLFSQCFQKTCTADT